MSIDLRFQKTRKEKERIRKKRRSDVSTISSITKYRLPHSRQREQLGGKMHVPYGVFGLNNEQIFPFGGKLVYSSTVAASSSEMIHYPAGVLELIFRK
jgi:hypothetical protein